MKAIACIGNVEDRNAWSGIPNAFLRASRAQDFASIGWQLNPKSLLAKKICWNAKEFLATLHKGGFQYTREFIRELYKQVPEVERVEVISHFPLMPDLASYKSDGSFYLDATLHQNFVDYGIQKIVSPRVMRSALDWERDQYQHAKKIICMSSYAAGSVINQYNINPLKVHVIPGGANLNVDQLNTLSKNKGYKKDFKRLRLGFVGKDWRRKGLPYLLKIAEVLQRLNVNVEVMAAGFHPEHGPRHPLLHSVGYLDKDLDFLRYMDFVQNCHFGCLFSVAEAFGISNREFLAAGIPVIGFNVGGIVDTVPKGLGHLFDVEAFPEEVAFTLLEYISNPVLYESVCKQITSRQEEFTWNSSVQQMSKLWVSG